MLALQGLGDHWRYLPVGLEALCVWEFLEPPVFGAVSVCAAVMRSHHPESVIGASRWSTPHGTALEFLGCRSRPKDGDWRFRWRRSFDL